MHKIISEKMRFKNLYQVLKECLNIFHILEVDKTANQFQFCGGTIFIYY